LLVIDIISTSSSFKIEFVYVSIVAFIVGSGGYVCKEIINAVENSN